MRLCSLGAALCGFWSRAGMSSSCRREKCQGLDVTIVARTEQAMLSLLHELVWCVTLGMSV